MAKIDITPLIGAIGNIFGKAIEGAAEAVLEEVQEHIHDANDRVTTARKKIRERKVRIPRRNKDEMIGEVVQIRRERR